MVSAAMRRIVLTTVVALAVAGVVACKRNGAAATAPEAAGVPTTTAPATPPAVPAQPRVVARKYGAMGTEITLSAWTADEPAAGRAFDAGYDEIRRIEI